MTLITYLSRVHFADGVLEVALSSELELNQLSRPLLVTEQSAVSNEFSERVVAGLPFWCKFSSYEIPVNLNLKLAISALRQHVREASADVVIAFGTSFTLSIADASCRALNTHSQEFNASVSADPKLFAIPGVDGVPTMSMSRNDTTRKTRFGIGIQPTTVIIDPTLIMGESVERTSAAIADTLARCLSAHLSDGYNPPADGIALEGVNRILRNLDKLVSEDSLEMRRELMAASLNGTLAMQKETGISHDLCEILLRDSPRPVNKGALMRLLILVEVELLERSWTHKRYKEACNALGVPDGTSLRDWLSAIMEKLPLPDSLSKLGFDAHQIAGASEEFATSKTIAPSAEQLGHMLQRVKLRRSAYA